MSDIDPSDMPYRAGSPAGPPRGYPSQGYPSQGYPPPPGHGLQPPAHGLQPPIPANAPQTPYPNYGASQPPKKRRVWRWVGGVILVCLLGIGGCAYAVVQAVKPTIDTTNELMAAVAEGDFTRAAALSSNDPDCFGDVAEQELSASFEGLTVESYNFASSSVTSQDGDSAAVVTGTVTFGGGTEQAVDVVLVKEAGEWKVCGLR